MYYVKCYNSKKWQNNDDDINNKKHNDEPFKIRKNIQDNLKMEIKFL